MEIKSSVAFLPSCSLNLKKHIRGRTIKNLTPINHTRDNLTGIRKNSTNSKFILRSKSKKRMKNVISLSRKIVVKPLLSAESWVVYTTGKVIKIEGKNEDFQREVASLTKIMTCLTVIYEVSQRKRCFDEVVVVSRAAAETDGTTAGLLEGDQIKVIDLLYGMMLPSGNDAAMALAEYIGGIINREESPVSVFVEKMNKIAVDLEMNQTVFNNPHGMSTSINLSSASDICKLACQAMKNQIFSAIVATKTFSLNITNDGTQRKVEWTNTNLLLDKGFNGVKTGTTPAAGFCLCFSFRKKKTGIVGVLLGCKSSEIRWVEAVRLANYTNSLKKKDYKK
jgi:D-alanyl-D-alanine carboxypeptidase (penicillin-binding protein 5/6)